MLSEDLWWKIKSEFSCLSVCYSIPSTTQAWCTVEVQLRQVLTCIPSKMRWRYRKTQLHETDPLLASSLNQSPRCLKRLQRTENTHGDLQAYTDGLTSHSFYLPLGPIVTLKLPILKLSGKSKTWGGWAKRQDSYSCALFLPYRDRRRGEKIIISRCLMQA